MRPGSHARLEDVRFVTFNIHHGTVGRRGPVDAELLAEVCAGFEADVIALQEVDRRTYRTGRVDLAAVVAGRCAMAHVFGPSRWLPGGEYGNALLVRGAIAEPAVHRLPRVPAGALWQEPRTALGATVTVDGASLWVAVTHLGVPKVTNGPQLEHLLRLASSEGSPAVVLGDFNRSAGAVAPHATAWGFDLAKHGPTFPVHEPKRAIDHVLTTPGRVVVSAEVRSTVISDHAALIVDLA